MDSWKAATIAGLALFATQAMAGEIKKPGDRAMFWTTSGPTLFSSFASDATSHPSKYFGAAKADALAFIGSEGEIRGAQFEQASRYYHSTYSPPFMPDMQLAQVIATTY